MPCQVVFHSYYCGKQAYEVDDAVRTLSIALVTPILGIAVDGLAAELLQHGPAREGANKRGNSSRLTQSFHFFMFEPIFSPVNALNQPI